MNLYKACLLLIVISASVIIACLGMSADSNVYGAETWITPSNVSVYMTNLESENTVKIKNNKNMFNNLR